MRQGAFDAVIVHCAFVAQYVSESYGRVRILDYGDMDSAKWREYSLERNLPLSLGYGIEARKLRNYERNVASKFHHCTVTTHGEKEEFESLSTGVPCAVIPNGVDTGYFAKVDSEDSKLPIITFLGRMDYFPNIDGVCYFAEEIFPLVQRQIADARFVVVGSDPSRRVRALERLPGVSVTGHVPDVRSYVKDAAVTVAPLRIARGTQNKILESMAMGIPVIATPQAAKGIQAVPGTHLLVAESPEKFAQDVVRLLSQPALKSETWRMRPGSTWNTATTGRARSVYLTISSKRPVPQVFRTADSNPITEQRGLYTPPKQSKSNIEHGSK